MAIKTVTLTLEGQKYTIPFDQDSGKHKKSITAPATTSWSLDGHVYKMVVEVTDMAGNVTTVDSSHDTYGEKMKLRVKEKTAPVISVVSPSAGAYLTNNDVSFSFDITDAESGVDPETITAELDEIIITITKVQITNGYQCTYAGNVDDGLHILVINASDNDGNKASVKEISFTVDTVPPTLNITAPEMDFITNKQNCIISGITNDATSGLASVTVTHNGNIQPDITVLADGSFSCEVALVKGENVIIVKATDKAGKFTTVTRSVIYDPDAPVIISVDVIPNPVGAGESFVVTVEAVDY